MKRLSKRSSSETISEEAQLQEIDERHFLAQQIFFRRESRRWAQEELARASGLTQSQVATLEAGQANPTLRTLAKLANALACGVQELFSNPDVHGESSRVADRAAAATRKSVRSAGSAVSRRTGIMRVVQQDGGGT